MNTATEREYPQLLDASGHPCPLKSVAIAGTIDDILTTFTIRQTYTNDGKKPIEALYTFPIPMSAVLLDMRAHFGERVLSGTVLPATRADSEYNEAVEDGNAAILVKEMDAGLYHASFGNLTPGETATIEYRYAMQHTWNDRFLRVHLPTTIAPRYGEPVKAGLSGAATPEYTAGGVAPWSFTIDVTGKPATCAVTCPNHKLTTRATEQGLSISLNTLPDRDMVLEFESAERPESSALCASDREGYIVAADFMPRFQTERVPYNLDILVDCSGSMGGQSIAQAREGVRLALDRLTEGDWFNITAFGSEHKSLFVARQKVSAKSLATARAFLRDMDADMGGTETGAALSHVYNIRGGEGPRSILLITDGEIWSADKLYAKARASGCRIMTVGVGMAASEKTVRMLAEVTGGMCEIVNPNEDMARRIERQCMRIGCPVLTDVRVTAEGATAVHPGSLQAVYDGDTVHVHAHYADRPSGTLRLEARSGDTLFAWDCPIPSPQADVEAGHMTDMARMAAAYRLRGMTGKDREQREQGQQLALDYQLLSPWTSCLLVDERTGEDKADTLPTAVKVPQMLAHGWHGGGLARAFMSGTACCMSMPLPRLAGKIESFTRDILDWCRKSTTSAPQHLATPDALLDFMRAYSDNCAQNRAQRKPMSTLADLEGLGLPATLAETLRTVVDGRLSDEDVCAILMAYLLELHGDSFGDAAAQWITRCEARVLVKKRLVRLIRTDVNDWMALAS